MPEVEFGESALYVLLEWNEDSNADHLGETRLPVRANLYNLGRSPGKTVLGCVLLFRTSHGNWLVVGHYPHDDAL